MGRIKTDKFAKLMIPLMPTPQAKIYPLLFSYLHNLTLQG